MSMISRTSGAGLKSIEEGFFFQEGHMVSTNKCEGHSTLQTRRRQMSELTEEERMRLALARLQRAVEEPQIGPPDKHRLNGFELNSETNSNPADGRVDLASNNRRKRSCRSLIS
jgi:hypothetical protein